ncbi:MAG: hypothetical protein EXR45_05930 [Chloroflexi bacterium]|nr:hypothetical protein [Chloroflexota bacterium]
MERRHANLTATLGIAIVIAATILVSGARDAVATHERPKSRMDTTVLDQNKPVIPDGIPRTRSAEEGNADLGLKPTVPTHDGTGRIWARKYLPNTRMFPEPHPAIVILHGGSGMNSGYLEFERWWRDQGYVSIAVDSFGSRGIAENWLTYKQFGANMRSADAVATLRYLRGLPGIDARRIYMSGGSQGGGTVLRILTPGTPWSDEAASLMAAGSAWYPVCDRTEPGSVPLGSFTRPVLFLQGTGDTATPPERCADLATGPNVQNVVFPSATHAIDFRAPPPSHAIWESPERYDALAVVSHDIGYRGWGEWDEGLARYGAGY